MNSPILEYSSPRQIGRKTWLLPAIIGGVFILAPLLICGGFYAWLRFTDTPLLGVDTEKLTTAQIQNVGRFTLPGSAANVRAHLQGFQDKLLHVRFDIAPSDLPALLASTRCGALSKTEVPSTMKHSFGTFPWWIQSLPASFEAGEGGKPGSYGQMILVNESNPAQFTVFYICAEQ